MTYRREEWTPIRHLRTAQRCDFCWRTIQPFKPGTVKGDRGTKAYYQPERRVFECMSCHAELERAEAAREKGL